MIASTNMDLPLRLLLLENVSQKAVDTFRARGIHVDHFSDSMSEEQLTRKLGTYHGIGIRSKTKITARVLQSAPKLQFVACFCIGTNQVDVETCSLLGIPVFNSPFSNSRSVTELVVAQLIILSRNLFESSYQLRARSSWNKNAKGCHQVLGKTLGIIGYGHIGSQVSVLAQALGMRVLFYDIINPMMPLGSAKQVPCLRSLLSQSDFITLHVPETPATHKLISHLEFAMMKKGACLINDSRGFVVDIPALIVALDTGHVAGAALDVFPNEPTSNGAGFDDTLNEWATKLKGMKNVMLTPHIGGSTEEAQAMIGEEVAMKVADFIQSGNILGAVNSDEPSVRDRWRSWRSRSRSTNGGDNVGEHIQYLEQSGAGSQTPRMYTTVTAAKL